MAVYTKNWTREKQRESNRLAMRRKRQRDKEAKRKEAHGPTDLFDLGGPASTVPARARKTYVGTTAQKIDNWCFDNLKIPSGPLIGQPFKLADFQTDFFEDAFRPGIREAGLSVAKKNGKSGGLGGVILAFLVCEDLNHYDWRGAVLSETGAFSKELRKAMMLTAEISGLGNVVGFRETPYPGEAQGLNKAYCQFLAADKSTGHAIGTDLALIDEAGLLGENQRNLWDAMFASTSGRNGLFAAISIQSDGPMFAEMKARAGEPGVVFHEHAGDPKAAYDDVENWHKANPGLALGIKSMEYMQHAAARAMSNPRAAPTFAAFDLNLPQSPTREMICSVADWSSCIVKELPPREGPCFLGFDLGGSTSMTAAAACWPSGRFECWGAFGVSPGYGLKERGEADGEGGKYVRMRERGELLTTPGKVVDLTIFLDFLASELAGNEIHLLADRYRDSEMLDELEKTEMIVKSFTPRGTGASATADGSEDVRGFQTDVVTGYLKTKRSLLMELAISNSTLSRDSGGNPKLDKAKSRGRIDPLSAGVMAVTAARKYRAKPKRKPRLLVAA